LQEIPTAFYTGIFANYQKAQEVVCDFWRDNKINITNSQLRQKTVSQETSAPPEKIKAFLINLAAVSLEEQKRKSLGEEKYLGRLLKGDDFLAKRKDQGFYQPGP